MSPLGPPADPADPARPMTVGVVGLGHLGAVHAACMADLGHVVVGYDIDQRKVDELKAARAPFFEPGLADLLGRTRGERLHFTTDPADLKGCQVVFVCVGTPQRTGELAADTSHVQAAVGSLAQVLSGPALVVGKSTVPVGTAARLAAGLVDVAPDVEVAWNPEFLREGHAVADTLHPDRLVFGVVSARAERLLRAVYAATIADGTPVIVTDLATAELVKVAANAFLAMKISFINAMAELCEAAGGDVTILADAIGHDDRIGRRFRNAGLGFGGGCLPKDIRAFMVRAGELGCRPGADLPAGGGRDQHAAPLQGRRTGPRRVVRREEDRGARCGVQTAERRHPRLTRAQRRRPGPPAGCGRRRDRPRGRGQRPPAVARPDLRRDGGGGLRRRGPAAHRVAGVHGPRPGRPWCATAA